MKACANINAIVYMTCGESVSVKGCTKVTFTKQLVLWVLGLVIFLCTTQLSHARQLAIVVGIDNYQYGSDVPAPGEVLNLQGAENDARLIADALRSQQVDLPDSRLLLGKDATREGFLAAWQALQSEAQTGDTIYVSFAGHGGQELEFAEPLDEQQGDGHDETLMFWDFDPTHAQRGRLTDDELYSLFKDVSAQRIVLIADTCHSGGLTRSSGQSSARSRNGGRWQVDVTLDDIPQSIASEGEDWNSLAHVTYITATADEAKTVDEITVGSKRHGALSVSFAQGIRGAADRDGNGLVLRHELEEYVSYQVATYSNRLQKPGFSPRGAPAQSTLFTIAQDSSAAALAEQCQAQQVMQLLPYDLRSIAAPDGLIGAKLTPGAALRFEQEGNMTLVFYELDEVTRFASDADVKQRWQSIIDKYRLLRSIDHCFNSRVQPISIQLHCEAAQNHCDVARPVTSTERLEFRFGQTDKKPESAYFLSFNLAGSGELQWLYPYPDDAQPLRSLPFVLGNLTVAAPPGRDDLVAALCERNPRSLVTLLEQHDSAPAPPANEFVKLASNYACQWGRYATFTTP